MWANFDQNGVCSGVFSDTPADVKLPDSFTSMLPYRYRLVDGQVVDQYPDKSDADVLAQIEADAQAASAATRLSTLDAQKQVLLDRALQIAEAQLAQVMAGTPQSEVVSWDQQFAEANAYTANPKATVPLLTVMSQSRGITLSDLVGRVLAKALSYTAVSGAIIGRRQAIEDAIAAAADPAALDAIDVTKGWPSPV